MLTRLRSRVGAFLPAPPAAGVSGDPGLFGPGTAAWRVGRERALLLAGPAALLLQVAHPLVGAGVAEHSDFAADPLRRLRGTLEAVLTVTFGDHEQVLATARSVGRRHAPVRGGLDAGAGPYPAGTSYRAQDPALAQWVWATLVWSALRATRAVVRSVPPAEADAYVVDMVRFGRLFAVPSHAPADAAALEAYVRDQVDRVLAVGPTARELADRILRPRPPVLPRPLRPVPALLAAALLPEEVRVAYGLPWRRRERVVWGVLRPALHWTVRLLPRSLRWWPHAQVAQERLDRAGDARRTGAAERRVARPGAPGHTAAGHTARDDRSRGAGPVSASGTSGPRTDG